MIPEGAEQVFGEAVMLLVLIHVFTTVLYARAGSGMIAPWLSHLVVLGFRHLSRAFGRQRGIVLSFCGLAILVGWSFPGVCCFLSARP